jgi:TPR repeat protein
LSYSDTKIAIELWEQAANQGFANAQFNLGCFYANGTGVSKNKEKAFELYQQAANQGHAKAQKKLKKKWWNLFL